MLHLSFVTALWAFSFSLIGVYLAGQVDSWFSAVSRVFIATLIFLPFIKFRQISLQNATKLMAIGAIQIGAMYGFYYHSFLYLSVPEVLLFTVMTPVYIALINDLFEKRFQPHHLLVALVATIGAITIRYEHINEQFWIGLCLVQGANLCFALGQVCYKRLLHHTPLPQLSCFGFFFIGALVVSGAGFVIFGDSNKLPTTQLQWGVLLYLGLIASGLGYFLWNKGATLVSVGTLAAMNNVLVPAGILVNLVIWNRDESLTKLAIGSAIILLALYLDRVFEAKKSQ
ncbi:carboxylate/amino acid/amine transporter [Pseudoalteromonas luteoviolacea]|uniref:EamA domain-containing protein n=1 Tax=Pseudoalteromonas luteoviolacea DSM 6061 TaxID=1365250 RepID=A0A166XVJ4_9GAMM|nr:carboxylate/amino acid/amine transporter [Pseudoalteromonas luteoviolacea]KZN40951.1 hypothetical protein N475_00825 [Pseudoalteromonas luteoviolacea DSM 6061]MBE0386332.1 hypothetical protein [Pseudoalteromonas luteoviolacea DSM 6061]